MACYIILYSRAPLSLPLAVHIKLFWRGWIALVLSHIEIAGATEMSAWLILERTVVRGKRYFFCITLGVCGPHDGPKTLPKLEKNIQISVEVSHE